MLVKIFSENTIERLEKKINVFLKSEGLQTSAEFDFSITSYGFLHGANERTHTTYSVLIKYPSD